MTDTTKPATIKSWFDRCAEASPGTNPQHWSAELKAKHMLDEITDRRAAQEADAWTKERVKELAKSIALAAAKNAGTEPQLIFPHTYLELSKALLGPAAASGADPKPRAREDDELGIGVIAHAGGATVCIMRWHSEGSITMLYNAEHPIGDSSGRALLNPPTEAPNAIERRRDLQHAPLPRDAECALERAALALDKAGDKDAHQHVTTVLREHLPLGDGIEPGLLVARKDAHYLRSGAQSYSRAVVASVDPFILISEEGDMLWCSTVQREDFSAIGTADEATMEIVNARLKRHLQQNDQ